MRFVRVQKMFHPPLNRMIALATLSSLFACNGGNSLVATPPTVTPAPTSTPDPTTVESVEVLSVDPPYGTHLGYQQRVKFTLRVSTRRARPLVWAYLEPNADGTGNLGEESLGESDLKPGVFVTTTTCDIFSIDAQTIQSVRFQLRNLLSPCDSKKDFGCEPQEFVFPANYTYSP